MKVTYASASGRLKFEFESENDKKLFSTLAHIQEVFEETSCGCCKSERIRNDVREFDGNFYYKLLCDDCGATMDFGQHKTGDSLFPKRHDKETKELLPNRGWYHYKAPAAAPASQPAPKPATQQSGPRTPSRPAKDQPASSGQKPQGQQQTSGQIHARVLAAYRSVATEDLLQQWASWAAREGNFTPFQEDEQAQAYDAALERLGVVV